MTEKSFKGGDELLNNILEDEEFLEHFGVKGMRWGVRRGKMLTLKRQLDSDKKTLARLNNGEHMSVGATKKRQAAFDKRDKAYLEKQISKREAVLAKKESKSSTTKTSKTSGSSKAKDAASKAIEKNKERHEKGAENNKKYQDAKREAKKTVTNKVKDVAKKATEDKSSADAKKAKAIKKKKLKEMSNDDLATLNKRMQLEKSYKELKTSDKSKGAKVVGDILTGAGKEVAKNRLAKTLDKGLDKSLEYILTKK